MFDWYIIENNRGSLLKYNRKLRISGGSILTEIKKTVEDLILKDVILYDAEDIVKNSVISKYGMEYYIKNGEGIHAFVEEIYNDVERIKHPLPENEYMIWY